MSNTNAKWDKMPDDNAINDAVTALKENGFKVLLEENAEQALACLKGLIPKGSEVMVGGSVTLEEIGFTEYLAKGSHGWRNLYAETRKECDAAKRSELRRKAVAADYFVSGINAITMKGALVACDMSGSRVGAYPFAAKNLILVSGVNKLTGDLDEAFTRVREHAFPLTNKLTTKHYGFACCMAKWVILEREPTEGRTTIILVKSKLGF